MVYVIPTTKLLPSGGWTLSAVMPDGSREPCQGCAAGTLLEAADSALVDAGLDIDAAVGTCLNLGRGP